MEDVRIIFKTGSDWREKHAGSIEFFRGWGAWHPSSPSSIYDGHDCLVMPVPCARRSSLMCDISQIVIYTSLCHRSLFFIASDHTRVRPTAAMVTLNQICPIYSKPESLALNPIPGTPLSCHKTICNWAEMIITAGQISCHAASKDNLQPRSGELPLQALGDMTWPQVVLNAEESNHSYSTPQVILKAIEYSSTGEVFSLEPSNPMGDPSFADLGRCVTPDIFACIAPYWRYWLDVCVHFESPSKVSRQWWICCPHIIAPSLFPLSLLLAPETINQ